MYPSNFNKKLNANNVIELEVDHSIVQSAHNEVADVIDSYFEGIRISEKTGIGFYSERPGWNGDLRWVSAGNRKGFEFFDKYFRLMEVASKTKRQLGDHGELIMYSGFFVVRSQTTEPYYHDDYGGEVGMNAFTLMTPVMQTGDIGNLLYHDKEGNEQVYDYQTGTAVCFGGEFYHSTEPFESDDPYVFLCFTYGVTDMDLWEHISETAAYQGTIYRHPDRGIVANDET